MTNSGNILCFYILGLNNSLPVHLPVVYQILLARKYYLPPVFFLLLDDIHLLLVFFQLLCPCGLVWEGDLQASVPLLTERAMWFLSVSLSQHCPPTSQSTTDFFNFSHVSTNEHQNNNNLLVTTPQPITIVAPPKPGPMLVKVSHKFERK